MAVRTKAGMFDVSHMGEILVKGPDAEKNLNMLLTNDYSGMADGQARYSPMCNEEGGVVDDLIGYKVNDQFFLLVVNAANKDKDYKWICDHQSGDVTIEDISAQVGQIALQGPKAMTILKKLVKEADIPAEYYAATYNVDLCGSNVMISTTGYTGEEGVEIYMPWEDAPKIWEALMEAGADEGLIPCGLGARDTLRLEAGLPLYGHEMGEDHAGNEMPVSIKEITLRKNHPWNGTKIRDVDISRQSYFVMIKRAGAVMSPWDDLVLKEGDKAFLLSKGRRNTDSEAD
jgi:aminomethyltransferase